LINLNKYTCIEANTRKGVYIIGMAYYNSRTAEEVS